ncbi:MAG: hypothetical protein RL708_1959 [Bacteroidota bacterium]|jgi:cobalt-zinc-cadmium efflux system membrane fusion protein
MKYLKQIIAITATVAILQACHSKKENVEKGNTKYCLSDSMQRIVKIEEVDSEFIKDELTLTGQITYDQDKVVKIFPYASGQVMDVKVTIGDYVHAGQTLAILKSAEIAGTNSDLAGAKADMEIAKKNMEQTEQLYKSGISSEKDFLEAKQNYDRAKAALTKSQSIGALYGSTGIGSDYIIKAPISGYVVEKKIATGMTVRTDAADNLFTISDLKDVWVMANVFETDIEKVKEGYEAAITTLAYKDKIFKGRIERVSEVLDPDNKVLKVRVRIPNDGLLLKPDMFAQVIVTNKEKLEATVIPSAAVIFEFGKYFVIKYKSNCDLSVSQINIIKEVEGRTYVRSGIKKGDKVLSAGQLLVYNQLAEE